MDVHLKLDEITRVVQDARAMPMSASCLVNREEVLGLLGELRTMLPEQLQQADDLLSDRAAVVGAGRDAATRLVNQARAEHDRLVEDQAVVMGARERASAIVSEANAESTRLLSDADDYVDRKLAEFEIALDKLTQQVARGRARLGARRAADHGRLGADPDDPADSIDPAYTPDLDRSAPESAPESPAESPGLAQSQPSGWPDDHADEGERAQDDLKGFGLGDSPPLR
jgi:cell division septum initiation protein DivIVA